MIPHFWESLLELPTASDPSNKPWALNYSKSLQFHMRGRVHVKDVTGRVIRFLEVTWNRTQDYINNSD